MAENNDADVRADTARTLKYWEQHEALSPKMEGIVKNFQKDGRAIVRHTACRML